jgi:hypothetical protein
MTLSINTLGIRTLSTMLLGIMPLRIMTFNTRALKHMDAQLYDSC